jgi:hypothetical protein
VDLNAVELAHGFDNFFGMLTVHRRTRHVDGDPVMPGFRHIDGCYQPAGIGHGRR